MKIVSLWITHKKCFAKEPVHLRLNYFKHNLIQFIF